MQSSFRGVRAANEADDADDEGMPTGGEVYTVQPAGGGVGQRPPLKKVFKKLFRPTVVPVINCIAVSVWRLLGTSFARGT